jgi:hypothetical protein
MNINPCTMYGPIVSGWHDRNDGQWDRLSAPRWCLEARRNGEEKEEKGFRGALEGGVIRRFRC